MKHFKIILIIFTLGVSTLSAQDKKGKIDEAVSAQQYIFKATAAFPTRGRTIQLNTDYSLTVKKDSVIANLPYFGRAYSAPIDPTNGGINFTSTKFDYKLDRKKKGGYEVQIKTHDAKGVQQLYLTISKNGYGSLNVTSQNRQAITFNGYVEDLKSE